MPHQLSFSYDSEQDVLTIEGIHYSGALFREYGLGPSRTDTWHRIVERRDGVLIIEQQVVNSGQGARL